MEITEECWHRNNLESHIAVRFAFDSCVAVNASFQKRRKKNKKRSAVFRKIDLRSTAESTRLLNPGEGLLSPAQIEAEHKASR